MAVLSSCTWPFFHSLEAYDAQLSHYLSCVLFPALTTLAEVPTRFAQRPIIDRHQKSAMYHPFIEAVSLTLIDIPIMLFTVISFCIPMYFIVRLQHSASQFLCVLRDLIISSDADECNLQHLPPVRLHFDLRDEVVVPVLGICLQIPSSRYHCRRPHNSDRGAVHRYATIHLFCDYPLTPASQATPYLAQA